jgi:hypothetical protein
LNVAESPQIWLSGAGVSEETEWAGSGPKDNSAGIDPIAAALAMAGANRARAGAFLKDQQEPIAAQLHRDPDPNRTRWFNA